MLSIIMNKNKILENSSIKNLNGDSIYRFTDTKGTTKYRLPNKENDQARPKIQWNHQVTIK